MFLWGFIVSQSLKKRTYVPYTIRGGSDVGTVESHTYYYYKIKFPHGNVDPSQPIIFYDSLGQELYTLPPYETFMNYGEGVLSVPGNEQNTQVENVATATYYVFYSSDNLIIDYENTEFKISKKLIKNQAETTIRATFEYLGILTPFRDIASVIDGRWDTQVQTEFYSEPPTGYNYAILDLGSTKTIQAFDLVAGFYIPDVDGLRKFDIDMNLTIKYSLDNVSYYDISDATHSFKLTGGESISFEEDELGIDFQARYLKLILENVKKIDYGQKKDSEGNVIQEGIWVVALTEIAAYDDVVLRSEAELIPTTYLANNIDLEALSSGSYPDTVVVDSTSGFELSSGETSGTAYIENSDGSFDSFTYTDTTSTAFLGVYGLSSSHSIDAMVVQSIETDTTLYDYDGLLPHIGDRVYKKINISDEFVYTQSQLDYVAKRYLIEFYKKHNKRTIDVLYAPHLQVGQTVRLVDPYNNENTLYFIESIKDNDGFFTIVLARYRT